MRRVGELHAERREQLAEITVREMGTPNEQALDETDFCVDIYGYYADNGPDLMKDEPIELLAGEVTVAIHISLNQADGGGENRTRVRSRRQRASGTLEVGASISATRRWPPSCRYGSMFWFSRKKFVGSYARFSSTKRSYCRSP